MSDIIKADKRVYFGHPINTYNTGYERYLEVIIKSSFKGGWKLENPNQAKHSIGYKNYKKEYGDGMLYYMAEVLPFMDAGVFLSFDDGMFGAGVYTEAQFIKNNSKPIYEISNGIITDLDLDSSRRLSVSDTRSRVYE